jgi:SAM-dependent methyltransferase
MHEALARLGVPKSALVLEPGCGPGRFMYLAPEGMRFLGVELDGISGRIARALHPGQGIRIENFRDTRLPEIDAVIGNPPFADIKLDHRGQKLSLHDFFFAKSVDALKPGGVLALVTSHYTLDRQNGAARDYLAERADFLGAIRLPSDAFQREGTSVVTDILFLCKRAPGDPARHADPDLPHGHNFLKGQFVFVTWEALMSIRIIRVNLNGGLCQVTGQECDELFVIEIQDDRGGSAVLHVSVNALVEMARGRARPSAHPEAPPVETEDRGANGRSVNITTVGG